MNQIVSRLRNENGCLQDSRSARLKEVVPKKEISRLENVNAEIKL